MRAVDPLLLDFATLSTLCLVHAKKSFSAAADELRTSQSTVSYTVDRLRKAFDDPLFVRQGGRTVSTPRCDDLVVEARLILEQFNAIVRSQEFDPSTAKLTLRISSNYYERIVILPKLIRAVRNVAPGVHIMMIPAQNKGGEQLLRGETDVLLSPAKLNLNGVYAKQLIKDRYVCLIDRNNPLATDVFTEEMFRAANHAYVSYAEIWRSEHSASMRRKGLDVNRVLSIASPENLSELLEGTDMIAAVPARVAKKAADTMAIRDCPFPAPFQVSMYWTARTHRSKMHLWLRDLLVQVCADVAKESP
ncbi:MAG: LysR family transcriptional regulator [Sulfitobacter sp.]